MADWVDHATAELESGRLDAADSLLALAFAAHPHSPWAHLGAAQVAMRRARYDDVRRHLSEMLRWGGTSERCLAYINLGILDMREGRRADGRASFEAARHEDLGEPSAYVHLARWQLAAGRPDSAAVILREGLALAYPTDPVRKALEALGARKGL